MYYLNLAYQSLFSFCHAEMIEIWLLVECHHNAVVFLHPGLQGGCISCLRR